MSTTSAVATSIHAVSPLLIEAAAKAEDDDAIVANPPRSSGGITRFFQFSSFFMVLPFNVFELSEGGSAGFASAYTDGFFERQNEDFAVADLAGFGRALDGFHHTRHQ